MILSSLSHPFWNNQGRQATSLTNQDSTLTTTTHEETLSLTELARVLHIELKLESGQIARTVALLDEGNTIPFIARYRKEVTGSLDEVQIQAIADRAGA